MSAWIVDRAHIDVLVQALCESELVVDTSPDELGRILWCENVRSVAYRYPRDVSGTRPGPIGFEDSEAEGYTYRRPAGRPALAQVKLAAECYDYQACEHPGYVNSEACRMIGLLLDLPGVGAGRWGLSEADVHGEMAR